MNPTPTNPKSPPKTNSRTIPLLIVGVLALAIIAGGILSYRYYRSRQVTQKAQQAEEQAQQSKESQIPTPTGTFEFTSSTPVKAP